jgi:hypothetical protein
MKKIALLLPLFMLPFLVNAQKSPIEKLFKKYYGKEGFTTVLVNQEAFEVISHMEKSKGEINGTLDKIKRVRVIAQEDECDYKELVVVKESDQEVMVLAKEEDGKLAELLVLVGGKDNVLVSVEGSFTMEDLGALSQLEGLEDLGKIIDH